MLGQALLSGWLRPAAFLLDTLMAASLWWCVLFLGSVTQAFVCPAAARSTLPFLTQPHPIGVRPIMDSGKVVPALLAIDGNDGPLPMAKTFWREATKNFASKAVQRQQGEELIKLSGELETLSNSLNSLNSKLDWNRALLVLSFALQLFSLGVFLGRTGQ